MNWLDKIYGDDEDEEEPQDIEVRGCPCDSKIGKLIYFCPSGPQLLAEVLAASRRLGGPSDLEQFVEDLLERLGV